jgi:uncharacterized Zn finger protein
MSHTNAWWERHGPGLPSHGIRAQTQRGAFGKTWWATRWIAALERLVNPGRLARGRNYARTGRVLSLDIERGKVTAVVQGSRPQPYEVSMTFRTLDDAEWERVIDRMSSQALYAARLLSGEMPEDIEDVFAAVGTSLFPKDERDMQTRCTCPDWANPCKHIAAVHYLLGERFDEDPFLMFLLRGRSQDEIVAALRARRSGGAASADAETLDASSATFDVAHFWTPPDQPHEVALHFALPETNALAAKRLGPLPFARDQEVLTAALESMYQHIGEYALLLALGDSEVARNAAEAPQMPDQVRGPRS